MWVSVEREREREGSEKVRDAGDIGLRDQGSMMIILINLETHQFDKHSSIRHSDKRDHNDFHKTANFL